MSVILNSKDGNSRLKRVIHFGDLEISMPNLWITASFILVILGASLSHWYFGNKLTETTALVTLIIIGSGLWFNGVTFYYTYTANQDKFDFDRSVHLEKIKKEEQLAQDKLLHAERISHEKQVFNSIVEIGFTSNTSLLEQRLKSNTEALDRRLSFDRKQYSLEIISEWYKDFDVKIDISRELVTQNEPIDVLKALHENPTLNSAAISILNYFEKIALAVENDVADELILKYYFKDIFKLYYYRYFPLIKERRESKKGSPSAFSAFCDINIDWGANPQD